MFRGVSEVSRGSPGRLRRYLGVSRKKAFQGGPKQFEVGSRVSQGRFRRSQWHFKWSNGISGGLRGFRRIPGGLRDVLGDIKGS